MVPKVIILGVQVIDFLKLEREQCLQVKRKGCKRSGYWNRALPFNSSVPKKSAVGPSRGPGKRTGFFGLLWDLADSGTHGHPYLLNVAQGVKRDNPWQHRHRLWKVQVFGDCQYLYLWFRGGERPWKPLSISRTLLSFVNDFGTRKQISHRFSSDRIVSDPRQKAGPSLERDQWQP